MEIKKKLDKTKEGYSSSIFIRIDLFYVEKQYLK